MKLNILFTFIVLQYLTPTTSSNDGLDFLVLGDWGGLPTSPYITKNEVAISKQMKKTAMNSTSQFVIALGDNFYYDGVKDVNDDRFTETYADLFEDLQLPWYPIAGNHDHHGNVSAQIEYTKHSDSWNFPDYWYSKQWEIAKGSNSTLKIVLIDTILLCGNTGYDEELLQPTGPANDDVAESQWKWLESQLYHSKDEYLVVGGHFPVWSIAEHGPTKCLVDRLLPMLEKYNVNAYLCGHDHNLQHIKESRSNVHYFVIGAANFIKDEKTHSESIPERSLQFYWAEATRLGGFAHVHVDGNDMKIQIIDAFGDTLHEAKVYPRKL